MRVLLNLLPEEGRAKIRREYYNRFFFWQAVFLLSIETFYVGVLGGIFLILHENRMTIEQSELSRAETYVEAKSLESYEEKFREVNRIATQSNRFDREHLSWTELLSRLDRLVPEQVAFTKLSTKEYQVFVSGKAVTRDDFLELERRLKGEECFTELQTPVSNLFSEKNVDFQIDFSVKTDCIKGRM